ncbi:MAG: hypothetical protein ACREQM_13565 [Candidatus Dormibacteraceae bacterium]
MRARLVRIPLRGAMLTGAIAGLVPGLFLGCLLGWAVTWLAGAVLFWQHQVGFTLGVSPQLLPFGDQAPLLEQISGNWTVVIPLVGIAMAIFWGVVVSLSYGLLTVALNLLGVGAQVHLQLDDEHLTPEGEHRQVKDDTAAAPDDLPAEPNHPRADP